MANDTKPFITISPKQLIMFLVTAMSLVISFAGSFPWPPQRTHDLAAFMTINDCIDCGLGHISNSLISTPFYYLSKNIIDLPGVYTLTSLIFFISCAFILIFTITLRFPFAYIPPPSWCAILLDIMVKYKFNIPPLMLWM